MRLTRNLTIVITGMVVALGQSAGAQEPEQSGPANPGKVLQLVTHVSPDDVGPGGGTAGSTRHRPPPIEVNISPAVEQKVRKALAELRRPSSGGTLIVDCQGNYDHTSIQEAIDAAEFGDTIIVLPNTCTPENRYFENLNIAYRTLTIRSVMPQDPEVVAATVIDGSLNDLSTVRSAYNDFVLDGLTITGGSGTEGSDVNIYIHAGGGLLLEHVAAVVSNSVIINNIATWGGGLLATGCDLEISRTSIRQNVTGDEAPGIWFGHGTGAYLHESSCIITESEVSDNVKIFETFGTSCSPWWLPSGSPGIYVENPQNAWTDVVIERSRIERNRVEDVTGECIVFGGALVVKYGHVDLRIRDSLIADNLAELGAGLFLQGADLSVTIENSTIAGNIGTDEIYPVNFAHESNATLLNTTVYGNFPARLGHDSDGPLMNAHLTGSYSNVEVPDGSLLPGEGNINLDPAFQDPSSGDYHLSPYSPCINAGDPGFVPEPGQTDLDGDPRVLLGVVDMGAYEAPAFSDCNGSGLPDGTDIAAGNSSDCNANTVPDECDLAAGTSADCNENNLPDECDVGDTFTFESPVFHTWYFHILYQIPAPLTDVVLTFSATADLEEPNEWIRVRLNDQFVEELFEYDGHFCPDTPDTAMIVIPPEQFNLIVPDGTLRFAVSMQGSPYEPCEGGSAVSFVMEYGIEHFSEDVNDNGVPDECECMPDLYPDGVVDALDTVILLAGWGPCLGCAADLNHDGAVGPADLANLLNAWGPCT